MIKGIWFETKRVIKIAKKEFFVKLCTSLMLRGILLIIPVLFSYAITLVSNGKINNAIWLIIISVIITAIYRFFEGLNQHVYYNLYNKLYSYYNNLACGKTHDNSLYSLSRFSSSEYSNIVISDVDIISTFYSSLVIRFVQVVEFIIIFIYFYTINLFIFLGALILTIIMLFVAIITGRKTQLLNEKKKKKYDEMTASIYNYFTSIREIKSLHVFDHLFSQNSEIVGDYLNSNQKYIVKYTTTNQFILYSFELFRLLSIILGIYLITIGQLEIGMLFIIYNYYQKIIDNFSTILTINVEFRNIIVSLNRFNHLIEFSQEKKQGVKLNQNNVNGLIEFENIIYGQKNSPTLNKVSFTIMPNSMTVIEANNENVQSAIFDLLLKLNRQHEGVIKIDNYDIRKIDDASYYSIITSARKNSILFNMSIKDNLLLVEPDFEKIVNMCKYIGIEKDIMKLEKGYDTIINENADISSSTKELLVICRMLLKNSKILLFDRSINGLDKKNQKNIIELLKKLKKDHTVVVITHEKSIIVNADRIIDLA